MKKAEDLGGITRRRFVRLGGGAAVAAGSLVILGERGFSDIVRPLDPKVYVCPPCGAPCDKLEFDKPGTCPSCGMTLIEKAEAEAAPTVAILLFDRAEIIDFAGPWEVFGAAGYKVFTVAEKSDPVNCVYGQRVVADYTFENGPKADILLVPGGGVSGAVHNAALIKWVQDNAARSTHVMSVCTGAFILAQAGLLDGLTATTVRGGIDSLSSAGKNIKTVYDKRYVDNGKVITTAGLSSGIDGALHLVSKIGGLGTAQLVALGIEYDWDPDGKFARAALADRYLPNFKGFKWSVVSSAGGVDQWEFRALVSEPTAASDILNAVANQIGSSTPHIRGSVTMKARSDSGANSKISWKFTDDAGRGWNGTGHVEPSSDAKSKNLLSIKLDRPS